jgi:hypothetical protein
MSRIRTIKPAFFRSPDMAALPLSARLTYIGLWTYVDDEGRGVDDARLVKGDIWPLDDKHTAKKVEEDLALLAKQGHIERYEAGGRHYLRVIEWTTHQRISHPSISTLPRSLTETSMNGHEADHEPSGNSPESSGNIPEDDRRAPGRNKEGNKEEEGNKELSSSSALVNVFDQPIRDDDDRIRNLLDDTWRIMGRRRLDRRNDEVAARGGKTVPPGPRADQWIVANTTHDRTAFEKVALAYLYDDPTVTAEALADILAPELLDMECP